MIKHDVEREQSHWFLAQMGKKVLRPGGKELTKKLIELLAISPQDVLVEFAPGLGYSAKLALKHQPHSYIGIEREKEHVQNLRKYIKGDCVQFILGNAAESGLEAETIDKVFGEAMLSMHVDHRKSEIIKEANRILKKGGRYAIHELELGIPELSESDKKQIKRDLAVASKVNARPLSYREWEHLLEENGFKVVKVERNSMRLLEPRRLLEDEGLFGALRIGYNVLMTPKALQRINQLRKVFKKHHDQINAIAILAEKVN